ncbi:hypothetical protein [Cryptosporangium aurantiacum]|nr:hypothetical protein [Cryptosporangium aurantiacum]
MHPGRYGKATGGHQHPNGPCGECLHVAREADAAIAAEFDLPAEIEPSVGYVDVVAVERATAGEKLPLTPTELVESVYLMRADGLAPEIMARRLHLPEITLEALDLVLGVVEAIAAPLTAATGRSTSAPTLTAVPADVAA